MLDINKVDTAAKAAAEAAEILFPSIPSGMFRYSL